MTVQSLELIKTRTLFLKVGEPSANVVLVDEKRGNMSFTFQLKYVADDPDKQTRINTVDAFQADVLIETTPNALTELAPIEIGTYGEDNKALYIGIVVEPRFAGSEQHRTTISFYTKKI